jgi:hypothetical protein
LITSSPTHKSEEKKKKEKETPVPPCGRIIKGLSNFLNFYIWSIAKFGQIFLWTIAIGRQSHKSHTIEKKQTLALAI